MTEWSDAIKNAIVVVIIVVVVGIIFGFVYMAMQSNQEGQDKLSSQLSSFDEKSYGPYDGTEISGTQVVSAIQQFTGTDTAILVTTNNGTAGTKAWYCRSLSGATDNGTKGAAPESKDDWELATDAAIKQPVYQDPTGSTPGGSLSQPTTVASATTKSSKTYVNPQAKFRCCLNYNANGMVTGITMVQE